jgi:transposase
MPCMKFKRKNNEQSIHLPSRNTKIISIPGTVYPPNMIPVDVLKPSIAISVYPRYLEPIKLDRRAKRNKTLMKYLQTDVIYDYRLIKTKSNKYYFCFPYSATIQKNTSSKQGASDGGVRHFQTVYSPQGEIIRYGHYINRKISLYDSKLQSMKYEYFSGPLGKNKKLYKLRMLLADKLKNMIIDLHNKTANSMCKKFNTLIVPHFSTLSMLKGKDLSKQTKRDILTLAHSAFKRRLISKAELLSCNLIIPPNEYKTTMTCGICFSEDRFLKGEEIYNCPSCSLKAGRDINAPRNIFIRQLCL